MSNLTVLAFADKGIRFEKRGDRVWVSLTDMAKATGKQVGHWNSLSNTVEYLVEMEAVIGIAITETIQGGIPEKQGTWAIEEVAIKFAMWCNVKFEIWVSQQIRTLMSQGTVSISQLQQQPVLPPPQVQVVQLAEALGKFGIELDNPRWEQGMKDLVLNILGVAEQNTPGTPSERWLGVVERAEELGYKVGSDLSLRTLLGKHCVQYPLKRKQERRLCNGTQRLINVYLNCSELDEAIESFFGVE